VSAELPDKNPAAARAPRVAIVHDHLAQAGGAERVALALHRAFPGAPIFTAVYDADATYPEFRAADVRTSFLQRWARRTKIFRLAFPFYPAAFEHFDLGGFDVVVSSSSGFAKGVITGPETCHICYCHTPARFAWRYHEYVTQGGFGRGTRRVLPGLVHYVRLWDAVSAQRVDHFVANSRNVARRIRKFYGRPSEVVYPPVDVGRFRVAAEGPPGDYYLVVSRLLGYKRVDLAVEAMNRLRRPLKVVGVGPDAARLRRMSGPTVEWLGRLPDDAVADLLAGCRAFLFCGEEDFGIAPLEATASGRPVIAFGAGGALESVLENETGVFFREPTPEALCEAIERMDTLPPFDPQRLQAHARSFDVSVFQERMRAIVRARWEEHRAVDQDSSGAGP
jgi:glycosyltransferase involved in cell wall biosynthesis